MGDSSPRPHATTVEGVFREAYGQAVATLVRTFGDITRAIPLVVISVLLISLLEAFCILPSHLSHGGSWSRGVIKRIQGHIAGKMTKTNKIGYIASFPIPEVIQGINSYFLHAQKVNPDVELVVIWAYTWFDPAKEADAAKAMIEQGVDVIAQHTDSTAPLAEMAKTPGVIGFGQASDMMQFGPNARLSSIIDNWSPYYIARTQAVMVTRG